MGRIFEESYDLGYDLDDSDVPLAKVLESREYLELTPTEDGVRARLFDKGGDAWDDYLVRNSELPVPTDLSPAEAVVLREIIDSDAPIDVADLPIAENLSERELIVLGGSRALATPRGVDAWWANKPPLRPSIEGVTSGAVLLERMLPAVKEKFLSKGYAAFRDFELRNRGRLERLLQRWLERRAPVDRCTGEDFSSLPTELREPWAEAERLACSSPEDDDTRLHRWHITLAGNLRIAGVDVASGPEIRLRTLGARLHDLGYPPVTPQLLRAFELGAPNTEDPLRRLPEASTFTKRLVEDLSAAGATWHGAGVYLGLAESQWTALAAEQDFERSPGTLALSVLKALPAHPRVVAWVLGLEVPLGRGLVDELLAELARRGLARRYDGDEWLPIDKGRPVDETSTHMRAAGWPIEVWLTRNQSRLGKLDGDPDGKKLLRSVRNQLRDRTRDAGKGWHRNDVVRARHLSSVLRQVTERGLAHGCELGYAVWSVLAQARHLEDEEAADRLLAAVHTATAEGVVYDEDADASTETEILLARRLVRRESDGLVLTAEGKAAVRWGTR